MSRRQVLVWYYIRPLPKRPLAGSSHSHTRSVKELHFTKDSPRKQHAPSKPALTLERLSVVVIRNSLFFISTFVSKVVMYLAGKRKATVI